MSRTHPAANPAALVAAWLLDVLRGAGRVELSSSNSEHILLAVLPREARVPVRLIADRALTEARFAGWELDCE
ncbi:MAG: hypothetical protein ABI140_02595 [Jatrophihabitantaceae bacterium]